MRVRGRMLGGNATEPDAPGFPFPFLRGGLSLFPFGSGRSSLSLETECETKCETQFETNRETKCGAKCENSMKQCVNQSVKRSVKHRVKQSVRKTRDRG